MPSNIRSFELALERYGEETMPEVVHDRVTAVAFEAMSGMVEMTPVDTGRAKGNYQVTLVAPAVGEVDRLDATPHGSSVASPAVVDVLDLMPTWQPGDFIWIHNGVPYIVVLNDGGPNRQAHHMLERTVSRVRRMVA